MRTQIKKMPVVSGTILKTGIEYFNELLNLNENIEIYTKIRDLYAKK